MLKGYSLKEVKSVLGKSQILMASILSPFPLPLNKMLLMLTLAWGMPSMACPLDHVALPTKAALHRAP